MRFSAAMRASPFKKSGSSESYGIYGAGSARRFINFGAEEGERPKTVTMKPAAGKYGDIPELVLADPLVQAAIAAVSTLRLGPDRSKTLNPACQTEEEGPNNGKGAPSSGDAGLQTNGAGTKELVVGRDYPPGFGPIPLYGKGVSSSPAVPAATPPTLMEPDTNLSSPTQGEDGGLPPNNTAATHVPMIADTGEDSMASKEASGEKAGAPLGTLAGAVHADNVQVKNKYYRKKAENLSSVLGKRSCSPTNISKDCSDGKAGEDNDKNKKKKGSRSGGGGTHKEDSGGSEATGPGAADTLTGANGGAC